jgi:dTMP kinase
MKKSYFITLEGIEGCGKSTQMQYIKTWFEAKGFTVHSFREPGTTEIGEKLRDLILNSKKNIHPLTQSFLFLAARTELIEQKLKPLLELENTVILLDRYMDSTLVYQGYTQKKNFETELYLHSLGPLNLMPDLTLYFQIDYATSQQRQSHRGAEKDFFESKPQDFYNNLIEGYDLLAQQFPNRIKTIHAKESIEVVNKEVIANLLGLINA